MLIPTAPAGLLAPTVYTLRDVKICEEGNYQDKFGQIHRHQLIHWAANYANLAAKSNYAPLLLEHHPFTAPFFGYVYRIYVKDSFLMGDICLTKYGVEAFLEYKERFMGCGWSVGVLEGKSCIGELTLCRHPRVSTTHIMSLGEVNIDQKRLIGTGMRTQDGEVPVGDQIVKLVRDIVDLEFRGAQTSMEEKMAELQKLIIDNKVRLSEDD
jgi:hypothetical protein